MIRVRPEDRFTIRPPSLISGRSAWVRKKTPLTWTWNSASKSASVTRLEGGVVRGAGVVHEVVEPLRAPSAEHPPDLLDEAGEAARVARVEPERHGLGAGLLRQGDHLLGRRPVGLVGEDAVHAAGGERQHRGAAKTAAAAGDEGDGRMFGHGNLQGIQPAKWGRRLAGSARGGGHHCSMRAKQSGMDRLAQLELFTRIVERGGFSAAAADRGVSSPGGHRRDQGAGGAAGRAPAAALHPPPFAHGGGGGLLWALCVQVLADLEAAAGEAGGAVSGLVRVDVPGNLARTPPPAGAAGAAAAPPRSSAVHIGEGERFVDLVREGVDCVVRAGELADSDLVVRRLGVMHEVTCASPAYLEQHGAPASPDALDGHLMVGFVVLAHRPGWRRWSSCRPGGRWSGCCRRASWSVGRTRAPSPRGWGSALSRRRGGASDDDFASGALVEVLAEFAPSPTPVSILYPSRRQLSARVRVFVAWLEEVLAPHLRSG